MDYDIAIIGYGPVGAMAANMFGSSGLNIVVIEPKKEIWNIPRAVALDGQAQRIFQSCGISNNIPVKPIDGLTFINKKGQQIVYVDFTDHSTPNGYSETVGFSQPNLGRTLREQAESYKNITFKLGSSLSNLVASENNNELTVMNNVTNETEVISSKYLLACDGADSFVRKKLNIPSFDYKCEQDWIVVDYELDPKYEIQCSPHQICDYQRPTTLAPIMDRHIRWEFKYNSDDNQAEMEDEQNIREMMRPHAWRINRDLDISTGKLLRASKYRFHGLIADNFKLYNCFLLGDSAHQMPPFLGQGLCQGIKDVYNLHWKLTGVINGTYSKKILDTYSLERRAIVKSVTETAIKQGNIVGTQNRYIALVRDFILNCARQFPVLLNFFQFYHPWPIKDGLIDKSLFKNKANGIVIPQPDINIRIEDKAFDQYIGYKFALLVFDQDQEVFDEIKSLDSVKIFDENVHLLNANHPFNADNNFVEWQKKHNISAAIIRPDRHVYGSCDHHSIIQKIDKLSNKLHNNINSITS